MPACDGDPPLAARGAVALADLVAVAGGCGAYCVQLLALSRQAAHVACVEVCACMFVFVKLFVVRELLP